MTTIRAVFSDETLADRLVLKGGNALRLVYGIVARSSLDLDFSLSEELDRAILYERIARTLKDEFALLGHVAFDVTIDEKGPGIEGGYLVQFKIIRDELFEELSKDSSNLRRNAQVIDPGQRRKFRIEISRGEFCPSVNRKVGSTFVKVYSLEMIVAEKLRAICQQMPEYSIRRKKAPRARDFFDIASVLSLRPDVDLASEKGQETLKAVFAAKAVSLRLLSRVGSSECREFHRQDWETTVVHTVTEPSAGFDYYFEVVCRLVDRLESLWDK